MPERTDHENPELAVYTTAERRAFIYAFSEPLLYHDIPCSNFLAEMRTCLHHPRVTVNNSCECSLRRVADSRNVDRCNTYTPATVKLKSEESECNEGITSDPKHTHFPEFVSFHVRAGKDEEGQHIEKPID